MALPYRTQYGLFIAFQARWDEQLIHSPARIWDLSNEHVFAEHEYGWIRKLNCSRGKSWVPCHYQHWYTNEVRINHQNQICWTWTLNILALTGFQYYILWHVCLILATEKRFIFFRDVLHFGCNQCRPENNLACLIRAIGS